MPYRRQTCQPRSNSQRQPASEGLLLRVTIPGRKNRRLFSVNCVEPESDPRTGGRMRIPNHLRTWQPCSWKAADGIEKTLNTLRMHLIAPSSKASMTQPERKAKNIDNNIKKNDKAHFFFVWSRLKPPWEKIKP
jgi:hypothetical protein